MEIFTSGENVMVVNDSRGAVVFTVHNGKLHKEKTLFFKEVTSCFALGDKHVYWYTVFDHQIVSLTISGVGMATLILNDDKILRHMYADSDSVCCCFDSSVAVYSPSLVLLHEVTFNESLRGIVSASYRDQ